MRANQIRGRSPRWRLARWRLCSRVQRSRRREEGRFPSALSCGNLPSPLASWLPSLGASSEAHCLGKTDRDLLKNNVAEMLGSSDKQVMETGDPAEIDIALPDVISKAAAWYRMTKTLLRRADGTPTGILSVAVDISGQVLAGQELARRRVFLEKHIAEQAKSLRMAEEELRRWEQS